MNCNPGELAVIVRNTEFIGCVENAMGHMVTVDAPFEFLSLSPAGLRTVSYWAIRHRPYCQHCGYAFLVPDADLQPLRGRRNAEEPPPAESPLPKPMTEPML